MRIPAFHENPIEQHHIKFYANVKLSDQTQNSVVLIHNTIQIKTNLNLQYSL